MCIDETLSWTPHVEYVKTKVASKLGMLNRIRDCVPQSCLKTVCKLSYAILRLLLYCLGRSIQISQCYS